MKRQYIGSFLVHVDNSIRRDGLGSLLPKISRKVEDWWSGATEQRRKEGLAFDQRFGTETTDVIPAWRLQDVVSPNRRFASNYVPTQEKDFEMLCSLLPINPAEVTFVDLGSGKGKALLLAAEHGFKRIVGVEFSPSLHATAQRNIRKYLARTRRDCKIESVCMDAADYLMPAGTLVVYFFNPFQREVVQTVLSQLRGLKQEVYAVNFGSLLRPALCESGFLRPIEGKAGKWIYWNGGGK